MRVTKNKMKFNLTFLKEISVEKILLYLFSIVIYLPMIGTNIVTISLCLVLVLKYSKFNFSQVFYDKIIVSFLILYLIIFIGFLYGIEPKGIFNDLEKKLSFLILPISIYLITISKRDVKIILGLFFLTGFIVTTAAFVISVFNFFETKDIEVLFNHQFSENINFHATYLSTYLLFSLVFPLCYFKTIKKSTYRLMVIFITITILVFLIFLSVRIVWLSLFVLSIVIILQSFKTSRLNLRRNLFYFGIVFSVIVLMTFSFSPIKERFKEAINYNNEYTTDKVWGGRGIREMIWTSSLTVAKNSIWFGYGSTREVQKKLNNDYKKNDFGPILYMMKNGSVFNAHSQYIEEILKFGIILGIIFPLVLCYLYYTAIKSKNNMLLYFVLIISCISITETFFELNKGIVFFSFFIPVLAFLNSRNDRFGLQNKSRISQKN